ncbi:hypothetical protein MLD38_025603 [Melastoma candidum]|uniref:Uncharacterized protein n=1 Tax=Melastoma candidum TaxID=119954 RepID=A0ACB9NVU4_9MYRT|nr:hypothetical protein MLD38_025603 [Melastoma candidum]
MGTASGHVPSFGCDGGNLGGYGGGRLPGNSVRLEVTATWADSVRKVAGARVCFYGLRGVCLEPKTWVAELVCGCRRKPESSPCLGSQSPRRLEDLLKTAEILGGEGSWRSADSRRGGIMRREG